MRSVFWSLVRKDVYLMRAIMTAMVAWAWCPWC